MNVSFLMSCLGLAALPSLLWAQPAPASFTSQEQRPIAGVRELTFGGSGGSNRSLSDSFGGIAASYGMYFNNEWQGVIRQSLNYHNPSGGGTTWNGSTRLAADYHFTDFGMTMPFVGASFGRIYGSSLRDTWSAGLEAGVKHYLQRKFFVFGLAEYNWLFERARHVNNNFGSGQFIFTTGLGFNF
jgi:hypothetical protein